MQKNTDKQLYQPMANNTIGLIYDHGIEVVHINTIIRCSALSNSTIFHLTSGAKIRAVKTLRCYADFLEPYGFSRFNRGDLVNRSFVKKITKSDMHLSDGTTISLPKKRNKAFRDFVEALLNLNGTEQFNQVRFPAARKRKKD